MATPISGTQLSPAAGLMQQAGRGLYTGTVRVFRGIRGSTHSEKVVELRLLPMLPLALAVCAILYQQGAEVVKGAHGDRAIWRKILLESLLGSTLVEHTKRVYTLLGMGLGAYRAGQSPNALERLHTIINTLTTLGLGAAGVHAMKGVVMAAQEGEDEQLAQCLRATDLKPWRESLRQNRWTGPVGALDQTLEALEIALAEKNEKLKVHKHDWMHKKLVELRDKVATLQAEAMEHLGALEDLADKSGRALLPTEGTVVGEAYKEFAKALKNSRDWATRLNRVAGPMVGYIIGGLILGNMVSRFIIEKVDSEKLRKSRTLTEAFSGGSSPTPHGHEEPTIQPAVLSRPLYYRSQRPGHGAGDAPH